MCGAQPGFLHREDCPRPLFNAPVGSVAESDWLRDHADKNTFRKRDPKPRWDRFVAEMRSGRTVRIDREMYHYWLGVLPPVGGRERIDFGDGSTVEADFTFREGSLGPDNPTIAFWSGVGGTYFCRAMPRRP